MENGIMAITIKDKLIDGLLELSESMSLEKITIF
jgi:hypothetical protein